jgi:hypothetical protein
VVMNNSENTLTTDQNFSLVELETKRQELASSLRKSDGEILFTKKDGTDRLMKCTLREEVAIPYEKKTERTRESKPEILPVWDLEAAAWRSVNINTIKEVTFYGAS